MTQTFQISDDLSWTQTLQEVVITIKTEKGISTKEIKINLGVNSLKSIVKGIELLNGEYFDKVVPDGCTWTLSRHGEYCTIDIVLEKMNKQQWWKSVCKGMDEIDTTKLEPENSKLSDLEGDTRTMVEKMMYDQRQKQMGLPTSEQKGKADMLEKFKKMHPEMDFSNAKVNL